MRSIVDVTARQESGPIQCCQMKFSEFRTSAFKFEHKSGLGFKVKSIFRPFSILDDFSSSIEKYLNMKKSYPKSVKFSKNTNDKIRKMKYLGSR